MTADPTPAAPDPLCAHCGCVEDDHFENAGMACPRFVPAAPDQAEGPQSYQFPFGERGEGHIHEWAPYAPVAGWEICALCRGVRPSSPPAAPYDPVLDREIL